MFWNFGTIVWQILQFKFLSYTVKDIFLSQEQLVLMVHLEPQELKEFQVRAGVWDLKENLEKKETQD